MPSLLEVPIIVLYDAFIVTKSSGSRKLYVPGPGAKEVPLAGSFLLFFNLYVLYNGNLELAFPKPYRNPLDVPVRLSLESKLCVKIGWYSPGPGVLLTASID